MQNIQVSVVIPTCNGSLYIPELLHSVASQTRVPDEVIISDDDSQDGTLQKVERVATDLGLPVKIYIHPRAGITKNYLNGLSHTSGGIVFFADQDDVWEKSRVERYLNEFAQCPMAAVVSSDSLFVNEILSPMESTLRGGVDRSHRLSSKVNRGKDLSLFLKGRLPIAAHSLAIRSECKAVLLAKPVEIGQWWFEDWVVTRCLCFGYYHMIPEALTLYRQHARQVTRRVEGLVRGAVVGDTTFAVRQRRGLQLQYCVTHQNLMTEPALISAQEQAGRLKQMQNAATFLQRRASIITQPIHKRMFLIGGSLCAGEYHAYASGFLSAIRDMTESRYKMDNRED